MQQTASTLYREQTLISIEHEIASVKEIFRLQNAEELKAAEQRYLPCDGSSDEETDRHTLEPALIDSLDRAR
jgi:hypothetical protein